MDFIFGIFLDLFYYFNFKAFGTIFCVWISIWWTKYQMLTREVEIHGGGIRDCYLDSSCENLSSMNDNINLKRKKSKIDTSTVDETLLLENSNIEKKKKDE
jgi:hypothetical protein